MTDYFIRYLSYFMLAHITKKYTFFVVVVVFFFVFPVLGIKLRSSLDKH